VRAERDGTTRARMQSLKRQAGCMSRVVQVSAEAAGVETATPCAHLDRARQAEALPIPARPLPPADSA